MSEPAIGDNSVNAEQLRAIVERIENLEDEIAELKEDRKEIFAEATSNGFDAKIVRKIVAIRKQDRDKRREEEELVASYASALGMS